MKVNNSCALCIWIYINQFFEEILERKHVFNWEKNANWISLGTGGAYIAENPRKWTTSAYDHRHH
jgi:hypothetical protein